MFGSLPPPPRRHVPADLDLCDLAVLTSCHDELAARPDPALLLGVDLSLIKDADLAARVRDHLQVFTFNKFPARKRIQPLLDRAAAAGTARSASGT